MISTDRPLGILPDTANRILRSVGGVLAAQILAAGIYFALHKVVYWNSEMLELVFAVSFIPSTMVGTFTLYRWHYHPEGRLAPGKILPDYMELVLFCGCLVTTCVCASLVWYAWSIMGGLADAQSLKNGLVSVGFVILFCGFVGFLVLMFYVPLVAFFIYLIFGRPNKTAPETFLWLENRRPNYTRIEWLGICIFAALVNVIYISNFVRF